MVGGRIRLFTKNHSITAPARDLFANTYAELSTVRLIRCLPEALRDSQRFVVRFREARGKRWTRRFVRSNPTCRWGGRGVRKNERVVVRIRRYCHTKFKTTPGTARTGSVRIFPFYPRKQ